MVKCCELIVSKMFKNVDRVYLQIFIKSCYQRCGSETIVFGSGFGSHFRLSFGSGTSLTSKKLRIQFRIRL
jgi:hypothetical protein